MSIGHLTPAEVAALVEGLNEVALIDVREYEVIRAGHLYHSLYLPVSETEGRAERVRRIVPRLDTRAVLVGEPGEAEAEALRWQGWGYTAAAVLDGGIGAWAASGGVLFSHVCVPSKALAESARELFGTPVIQVEELAGELSGAEPPVVVDVRSPAEYAASSIPGAIGLPGGELVAALAAGFAAGRRVVVTCAFRTRGLFAAQSVFEIGLAQVAFLEGGTSAWAASGRPLAPGTSAPGKLDADPETISVAERRLAKLTPAQRISRAGLTRLQADTTRTTYVIDPRLHPGPVPVGLDAVHVPGGQLVEAVDEYLPVLRARVVLVDDPPFLRALAAARWLCAYRQLEVYLLDEAAGTAEPAPWQRPEPTPTAPGSTAPGSTAPGSTAPGSTAQRDDAATLDSLRWSRALPALAYAEPAGGFAL